MPGILDVYKRQLQNVDRILNEIFLYDLSEGKYKKRSGDYV